MGATTWTNRARVNVIDDGTTLATGVRAAGDYNNDANKDLYCNVYLRVTYSVAPVANAKAAELYVLPGDDAGPDTYPEGGDAGLGTNDTPQKIFLVGVFETINPSTSVEEQLALPGVPLHHSGNRFVILNTSLQTFAATWDLDIVPFTPTTA